MLNFSDTPIPLIIDDDGSQDGMISFHLQRIMIRDISQRSGNNYD